MNKYMEHLYVIPEDEADRQIANGFVLHHQVRDARIQVMPPAGGWPNVLKTFQEEYIAILRNYPKAHVLMLIDFDDQGQNRTDIFEAAIPSELKRRAFLLGSKLNPEALRRALKTPFEKIGMTLAEDCDAGTEEIWEHEQLRHNAPERERLVQIVRPFLF